MDAADNVTDSQDKPLTDIMDLAWVRGIFITIYCVIFIMGTSGNLLVIYVVLRKRAMRSITNLFITNLAISDLVMCLVAVPLTPLSAFHGSWIFGEVLCHVLPMLIAICVYVSTLTSMVIAIYRYILVSTTSPPSLSVTMCGLIIFVVWLMASFISMPLAIYQQLSWVEMEAAYVCHEFWPSRSARRAFTFTSFALQYVLPCVVITFCYVRVTALLRSPPVRLQRRCSTRAAEDEREIQDIVNTNKMLIAVIAIFVVCWLPLNCLFIIMEFSSDWNQTAFVFFLTHILAMCSTVYNPFVYAWMNEQFRKEFRQVLPCIFPKQAHVAGTSGAPLTQTNADRHSPDGSPIGTENKV